MCYFMLYDMVQNGANIYIYIYLFIYLFNVHPSAAVSIQNNGLRVFFSDSNQPVCFFQERLVRLRNKHVVPFCSSMFDCLSR